MLEKALVLDKLLDYIFLRIDELISVLRDVMD
jgi:hypothetical protein